MIVAGDKSTVAGDILTIASGVSPVAGDVSTVASDALTVAGDACWLTRTMPSLFQLTFGIVSKNPTLKNITDYLVDEGSYEEEALMGTCLLGGGLEVAMVRGRVPGFDGSVTSRRLLYLRCAQGLRGVRCVWLIKSQSPVGRKLALCFLFTSYP